MVGDAPNANGSASAAMTALLADILLRTTIALRSLQSAIAQPNFAMFINLLCAAVEDRAKQKYSQAH
jgi:hypothetical protein